MTRRVVVIGAGIVAAALAAELAGRDGLAVTVLERGPHDRLVGSTGHAPGLVGLLGEAPVATELARASAESYERLVHGGTVGFDRGGGLEVASTTAGLVDLERRARLAHDAGLPARVLDAAQAVACAPQLVDPARCVGGVLHPHDGTARAGVITAALQEHATRAGARFRYDAQVHAIDIRGGRVHAVHAAGEVFSADDVVIACGIWGPAVAALAGQALPLTPVQHPYLYGPPHGRSATSSPFVRWPEHHVYARDHGDRLGIGTYDHTPRPVPAHQLGTDAEQPWPADVFDPAVARALDLLPAGHRYAPEQRLNGVFSVTADNLPLLGPLEAVEGLWAAEALWVSHAAGAARALAQLMTGAPRRPCPASTPCTPAASPADELTDLALALYRGIYATASDAW